MVDDRGHICCSVRTMHHFINGLERREQKRWSSDNHLLDFKFVTHPVSWHDIAVIARTTASVLQCEHHGIIPRVS